MRRQTRRTFLATIGATGFAGCSALSSPGEETETNDPKESTTTTQEPGNGDGGSGPQVFEDFESLGSWNAVEGLGSLKKSTKQKYAGSQAAHVMGNKQKKEGKIFKADFASDGKPADLSGKGISLAYKCTSHQFSKISVNLYAPDQGHVVEMKRTLVGPKDRWVRVNLGTTGSMRPNEVDLSKVYEMYIVARPRDPNSSTPIEYYVDDVKTVPAPDKGMVMLTFDDSFASHYTKAFKMMQEYSFPGVDAVIPDVLYEDGFLTRTQMQEMVDKGGWDMIAHPNTGSTQFDQMSPDEQEKLMKNAKQWLKQYGFEGHRYLAVPNNVVGAKTFDLAKKHFDLTFSFGASPNALPIITKDTILSRIYGENNPSEAKSAIDSAARYNQLSVLLFHDIGGKGNITEDQFKQVLKYIDKKNVEVVTPTMLKKRGLLI